jgi:hypothetical protein
MSRYLITITPDNGDAARDSAHTTVRLDTSSGRTRITELTVRSASGGGLAPSDLPAIDMDLLIRALTATRPAQPLAAEPTTLTEEAVLAGPATPEPASAPSRRRGRKTTAKTAPARKATARKTTGRKATAGKATAAQKATATKTAKTVSRRTPAAAAPEAAGTRARAYRRMPDPEQVMDAYRQTGTIGGLAEHFNVPRHTIAGWARRLRTLGYTIGRQ